MNLYEYFNCESGDELFSLMESNSPDIDELNDFFSEVIKGTLFKELININTVEKFCTFLEKEGCSPNSGEVLITMASGRLNISSYKSFIINQNNPEETIQEINKYMILKQEPNAYLSFNDVGFYNGIGEYICDILTDNCKLFGIKLIDTYLLNKNNGSCYSKRQGSFADSVLSEDAFKNSFNYLDKEFSLTSSNIEKSLFEIKDFKNYAEFVRFFVAKKIKGLDAIKDELKIQELLKLMLLTDKTENVFYIAYDNNYKVLDLSFITEGNYTSCKLYVGNILVSTIMNNKTKFVSFVHNHPAGSLEPSSVDVDVSIKLHTALEAINKRYLEHYIVSYRGATRISDANNVLGQVKQEIIEDYYKFVAKKEESGYQFEFEDFEMGFG